LAGYGIHDEVLAADLARAFPGIRRQQFELFPGAAALLGELRADGYLLGLLTNGPPDLQRAKIRATGIEDAFDAVAISGEVGVGKPNPDVFRFVLAGLGVDASEAVMVGDNPKRDIGGGQAVGMRAIRIDPNGYGRPEGMNADAEIDDITQVRGVVGAWR
jgi:putative hydrolase of the HAD superfamily